MVDSKKDNSPNEFEIGAVSRITGISQHRLRMWERRYNMVTPRRNKSNRRYYSGQDVRKILLIKSLLDAGNSIGSIASLSISQLEEKIKSDPFLEKTSHNTKSDLTINVAVFGFDIVNKINNSSGKIKNLNVELVESDFEKFKNKLSKINTELLVLEFETLESKNIQDIYNLVGTNGANHVILIYWFSETKLIKTINRSLVTPVRSPIELDELTIICNNLYDLSSDFELDLKDNERLFKFSELASIASCSPTIECECPHQLVTLIYSLLAFEKYSVECESRNLQDAKLHRFLFESTSKARSLIEKALQKVAEIEGIKY